MKCRTYKCKAECCYNIVFEQNELKKYADKIVTPVVAIAPFRMGILAYTVPVSKPEDMLNNKCPFLRADYKCNIYENRPSVCRKFGEIEKLPCKYQKR